MKIRVMLSIEKQTELETTYFLSTMHYTVVENHGWNLRLIVSW